MQMTYKHLKRSCQKKGKESNLVSFFQIRREFRAQKHLSLPVAPVSTEPLNLMPGRRKRPTCHTRVYPISRAPPQRPIRLRNLIPAGEFSPKGWGLSTRYPKANHTLRKTPSSVFGAYAPRCRNVLRVSIVRLKWKSWGREREGRRARGKEVVGYSACAHVRNSRRDTPRRRWRDILPRREHHGFMVARAWFMGRCQPCKM